MVTLSNNDLTIAVKEHGAELCSIRTVEREYLWQSNPAFWNRYSPVLFPQVGRVWQGEYRVDGQTYKMGQHGFARDMEFALLDKQDDRVSFVLESSEETLQKYPYPFRLVISYVLRGKQVDVCWHVENTGKKPMYFQIGAHPAFYWPGFDPATDSETDPYPEDGLLGYFRLTRKGEPVSLLRRSVLTSAGCVDPSQSQQIASEAGMLPLDFTLFGKDALVLEDAQVDKVELLRADKTPYLTVDFAAPLVGLWSPPGKRAPFVCIEPWYGRCDRVDFFGDIADRDHINRLEAGACFDSVYTITVHS